MLCLKSIIGAIEKVQTYFYSEYIFLTQDKTNSREGNNLWEAQLA